jgi:predicted O-methyltransferase YrrM
MSTRTIALSDPLYEYLLRTSIREPEILRRLREETAGLEEAGMQISPEVGQLLALLVRLMGARRTLEVGVFTGYSSLSVARALPEGGRVVACDVSPEWTAIARRYWAEAGVAERIDLRLAPARETLNALLAAGEAGRYDFAFIDADKEGYQDYLDLCLALLRSGGLVAVDNTLWSGRVADPEDQSSPTLAIRRLNERLRDDDRVDLSLLPIGDGLTLARKR